MNKDLAGVSAIWRTLFGVRVTAFTGCFHVVKEAAENDFAADFGFRLWRRAQFLMLYCR